MAVAVFNALPFVGFGFLDNLIMILAVSSFISLLQIFLEICLGVVSYDFSVFILLREIILIQLLEFIWALVL